MAKHKTVSVVIPSWNSEKQLQQNLPFVFAAAAKVKAEIVIVDDHSQFDRSAFYLKSLGDKIRFYENRKNEGFSYTVNRGVKLAQGDIIMLLNTDVRPSPDCFVHALKYFADPSVYAVGFNSGEAWMGGEWQSSLFQHFKVEPKLPLTGRSGRCWEGWISFINPSTGKIPIWAIVLGKEAGRYCGVLTAAASTIIRRVSLPPTLRKSLS